MRHFLIGIRTAVALAYVRDLPDVSGVSEAMAGSDSEEGFLAGFGAEFLVEFGHE
jgi:hypothetical protein